MQKALIVFALLAIGAFASIPIDAQEMKSLWSSWKIFNGKAYAAAEEAARLAIFTDNYKKIIKFNGASDNVKLALNKFADLTSTEFKSVYASGYKKINTREAPTKSFLHNFVSVPDSVDWRSKGAVTKVKNQAQCGSCWSFATTGALEGLYQITHNVLLSFSEQQLVDCDTSQLGCNGGDPVEALSYTASNGVELEATYPYTAQDGTCSFKKAIAVKTNAASELITPQSVDDLKAALVAQPVSIAIEADEDIFQLYSSGVIQSGCGVHLDHAVLAVGYTNEYFIVKNSWGANWGQQGYVYLSTDGSVNNGSGACGLLSQPVVPTN